MIEIKLESEKAISEIIRLINIPDTYVYVVEKNGKIVNKYELVENDCELKLIPFITGG